MNGSSSKRPNLALVVGSYALVDFIRLNVLQCQTLWPFSPLLISDDHSFRSEEIERMADELGVHYICSERRRTHTSGDWQAFVNGSVFGKEQEVDWVVKISQRFIPLEGFAEKLEAELNEVDAVLPGRMHPNQIARPGASFYLQFGHLTDVVAYKPSVFTPQILTEAYNQGFAGMSKGDLFSEVAWDRLRQRFNVRRVDWMANHEIGKPKLYLRKASSGTQEYFALAEKRGVSGFFDCREWKVIEGHAYRSVPK